jgi:hypothetical protein
MYVNILSILNIYSGKILIEITHGCIKIFVSMRFLWRNFWGFRKNYFSEVVRQL